MSWSYRILKEIEGNEATYSIYEVYTNPLGWNQDPCRVTSDSVDGLRWQLQGMMKALDQPVIAFQKPRSKP
jgi:hypothetical protein